MSVPLIDPAVPATPDIDELRGTYAAWERTLGTGSNAAWLPTLQAWDAHRRTIETWANLTHLRFTQNTADATARAARERCDALEPVIAGLDTSMKRRFTATAERRRLEAQVGNHAFALWDNDLGTFAPEIEPDLVTEANRCAAYTQAIAEITVSFDGESLNLSQLQRYQSHPDRAVRESAFAARWEALGQRAGEFDALYSDLVQLRDGMARKLGYADFTALGYRRMRRVDYDRAAVERYRDAIVAHVVPVATAIARRAAGRLGAATLAAWDEALLDGPDDPRPQGDARWMMDQTVAGFAELHPKLGAFAALMDRGQLTDLDARAGKAGGGYCTIFPTYGVPFIFTNFNGTKGDVTVLMHELGHAFQAYSSREKPLLDYFTPTYDAAEVHSMSLEYLSWPLMERFFGDGAASYQRSHLAQAMLFLPYGVAVDHFQHLVYASPNATADERHLMWQWVERRYLPWRTYGNVARPARGAFWQGQQHIYRSPFYYIDYTLALCCALQMWAAVDAGSAATFERYVALCARGGEAPFQQLVGGAGIVSPFDDDALPAVVARVKATLDI
jgi:M3 family oligoendopeptidase